MSTQPLLSVIVPVYNVEQYLHQCVDSIIGQTYKNLEIILVNDGSTDGSGAICDEYATKDSRVRVIHKENGGQSSARNIGISISSGEYTTFVDSDDWLELDMYQVLIKQLLDTSADVITFQYVDEFDEQPARWKIIQPSFEVISPCETLRSYSRYRFLPMMPMYIYKDLKAEGLRCDEGKIHEDEVFLLEYFASTPRTIAISSNIYYHYRRGRLGSTTFRPTKRSMIDLSCGFLQLFERLKSKNIDARTFSWVNYTLLSRLEYQYNVSTYNGVKVREFLPELNKILNYTYTLPLPKELSLWEVKLFRKFPKLYCYFTRVYHPIARRLGIGRYSKSK